MLEGMRTAQGIPTFCASGDDGARDMDMGLNVDYPASSPFSFGCGGTKITLNDIDTEVAWDHSGGGISRFYQLPPWQARALNLNLNPCAPQPNPDALLLTNCWLCPQLGAPSACCIWSVSVCGVGALPEGPALPTPLQALWLQASTC